MSIHNRMVDIMVANIEEGRLNFERDIFDKLLKKTLGTKVSNRVPES